MRGDLRDDGTGGLTRRIIGAGIEVHRRLGPGLLEKTYQVCFAAELRHRGISVECQVPLPVVYRDVRLDCGYRIDMLVEKTVVVELKVVEKLAPVHVSQVLTYLRLADLRVGLLFNFNVKALAAGGFRRILLDPEARRTPFDPFDPSCPS
jgi:GxxExxY protein